jgi:hypothetical protein
MPGKPVSGNFRDEGSQTVSPVHRLAVVGEGGTRVALLVGRRRGALCIGAEIVGAPHGELDCFEAWENPPLVVRVVVGGKSRRRTDWLAVLGLARSPTARVVMDAQTSRGDPLPLRSLERFPWRAFAAITQRGDLGNVLIAEDGNGSPVVRVDLSWSYNPPCLKENEDVCGGSPPPGAWSEGRDPIEDASGQNEDGHRIAFAHPAIRRLAAGHSFFINPTAGWARCDATSLGSVVSFRIWPPVRFKGEIPVHAYAEEGEDVAYREGRAYVEAEHVASVEAWVDHERKRVVGIELQPFDETETLEEESSAKILRRDTIEEPKPAGGPDDSDACPEHEFGD